MISAIRAPLLTAAAFALLTIGCGGEKPADSKTEATSPAAPPATVVADTAGAPADSLVLTLPDSTEFWFTAGRVATAAGGTSCRERGLELRRKGERTVVPLFYTREAPLQAKSRVIGTLYANCVPGATYLIDPVTGQPTLRPARSR